MNSQRARNVLTALDWASPAVHEVDGSQLHPPAETLVRRLSESGAVRRAANRLAGWQPKRATHVRLAAEARCSSVIEQVHPPEESLRRYAAMPLPEMTATLDELRERLRYDNHTITGLGCLAAIRYLLVDGRGRLEHATRHVHRLLLRDPAVQPGQWRNVRVMVGGRICPPPNVVPSLIVRLLRWHDQQMRRIMHENDRTLAAARAVVVSGLGHQLYEQIHPFVDGNGRTGRAVAVMMLHAAAGHLPAISEGILADLGNYYACFDESGDRFVGWWAQTVESAVSDKGRAASS